MTKLSILYDAQCSFCLRCRQWLGEQRTLLRLDFIPFQCPELVAQFEGIESFRSNNQLLVVADDGAVYQGSNAFILLLYALRDYHEWAVRLATPALVPLAVQCFDLLASPGRKKISKWLSRLGDGELIEVLGSQGTPVCVVPVPVTNVGEMRNLGGR
jgi:predicted DCC family thiol-disulfide oxidoreductase YuxK